MTTTLVVPEGTTVRGTVGSNIRLCREVIKTADWIIDLGPEGGDKGGEIVATGVPEDVVKVARSYTGRYLKPLLEGAREAMA